MYIKSKLSTNKEGYINRAKVVNNKDPKGIGRVQIRIYNIHGSGEDGSDSVSDDALPWAFPCFFNASYDAGTFILPEVGNTVWIIKEKGSGNYVWLGGLYGTGMSQDTYIGYTGNILRKQPADTIEVPTDILDVQNPNKKVLYKSPKGSRLVFSDTNCNEYVEFIDALGQSIRLTGSLNTDYALGGNYKKEKSVLEEEVSNTDHVKESRITIKSVFNSLFEMISSKISSAVNIIASGFKYKSKIQLLSSDDGGRLVIRVETPKDSYEIFVGDTFEVSNTTASIIMDNDSIDIRAKKIMFNGETFLKDTSEE